MSELSGKVALVTGASRGIGRAVAVALARAGADVAVNFPTREDAARETAARIAALRRRGLVVAADVSGAAEVTRLVAEVEVGLGPVDVLVNNAGVARPLPPEEVTERDFDEMLAVNLKSAFLLTQAVLPGMRARRASWSASAGFRKWWSKPASKDRRSSSRAVRAMSRTAGPRAARTRRATS
jgi:3-oxoacyl-[acyl-carrier protein] reductase